MTQAAQVDQLGRAKMTVAKRLDLLEHDREQQSRVLTELIQKAQDNLTPDQLTKIVREALREELADAGLRLDGDTHQDAAREDFRFLRRFRLRWDGAANKIGNAILAALILVGGVIASTGFWAWISSGGRPS